MEPRHYAGVLVIQEKLPRSILTARALKCRLSTFNGEKGYLILRYIILLVIFLCDSIPGTVYNALSTDDRESLFATRDRPRHRISCQDTPRDVFRICRDPLPLFFRFA